MKIQINWDAMGVITSVACAIHCAALPLLLSSLPLFGINIINNIYFEAGMILLAFIIGFVALSHGFRRHHHRMTPLLLFSVGLVFLVGKEFLADYETLLLVPAVVCILSAHFLNYRYCRKAAHCHVTDCDH
jgi:MerC mercury resistance protein